MRKHFLIIYLPSLKLHDSSVQYVKHLDSWAVLQRRPKPGLGYETRSVVEIDALVHVS